MGRTATLLRVAIGDNTHRQSLVTCAERMFEVVVAPIPTSQFPRDFTFNAIAGQRIVGGGGARSSRQQHGRVLKATNVKATKVKATKAKVTKVKATKC